MFTSFYLRMINNKYNLTISKEESWKDYYVVESTVDNNPFFPDDLHINGREISIGEEKGLLKLMIVKVKLPDSEERLFRSVPDGH